PRREAGGGAAVHGRRPAAHRHLRGPGRFAAPPRGRVIFALEPWAAARRAEVDALMASRIAQPAAGEDPGRLVESMRYSLLAPGKRLRPLLALAAAEAVGAAATEPVRIAAASIELVHCYSLVH